MTNPQVPFFRPSLQDQEIEEVVATLRSGWLTSGKRVQLFEEKFASAVGAPHAVALNSCTAALHLAVEALGLKAGQGVLVPTMTFAATAEVVRYLGAIPILVDCDQLTLNMDLEDAARKLSADYADCHNRKPSRTVGIMPVHVGGMMMDVSAVKEFARKHGLWIVEDAAHAFPAAWRAEEPAEWQSCGQGTADVTCFSFYANKTITTGEGGMAVTEDARLVQRMREMSLHGLSQDAWERYSGGSSWDYKIVAPGFKYNLTDIAAALGIHQLGRAEAMRQKREAVARYYCEALADVDEIELPPHDVNRIHAWHLFPVRLRLDGMDIDRNDFIEGLKHAGVGCSVHWRPLHLHPYYQETFQYRAEDFPVATREWQRLVSLPIFPDMRRDEIKYVVDAIKTLCHRYNPRIMSVKEIGLGVV
jgi:perosamine synthetase